MPILEILGTHKNGVITGSYVAAIGKSPAPDIQIELLQFQALHFFLPVFTYLCIPDQLPCFPVTGFSDPSTFPKNIEPAMVKDNPTEDTDVIGVFHPVDPIVGREDVGTKVATDHHTNPISMSHGLQVMLVVGRFVPKLVIFPCEAIQGRHPVAAMPGGDIYPTVSSALDGMRSFPGEPKLVLPA